MAIIRPSNKFRGRRYPHGRHEGKLIELIILKYPDYINWLSRRAQSQGLPWLYTYIHNCITAFDALPFVSRCRGSIDGRRCANPVTRFTLYPNAMTPYCWCATCDPYQQGAAKTLTEATGYHEALFHIWATTSRNRAYYRNVIKGLARAKGFKGSFTEKKVIKFFYGPYAEPNPPEEGV